LQGLSPSRNKGLSDAHRRLRRPIQCAPLLSV